MFGRVAIESVTASLRLDRALLVMGLLACGLHVPLPQLAAGELIRLPPVRLPAVRGQFASHPPAAAELDDIVRLAGGAVELRVRQNWWIWEVPVGREVRVALSPTRPDRLSDVPESGHWVCFHLPLEGADSPQRDLAAYVRQRLLEVSNGRAQFANSVQFQQFGGWDAAVLEFSLPADRGGPGLPIRGSHIVVSTPWGLCEFHTQFRQDHYEGQRAETARLLQRVKLAAPTLEQVGMTSGETQAATPILGSWKAFRSRMRLAGDGTIEIATDRAQLISPPEDAAQATAAERLQGSYHAEGNLLFVQWRDGSKLNFRWKLSEGRLLLTDHDGQTSQLRRLAE